jgi:hypothetical protein
MTEHGVPEPEENGKDQMSNTDPTANWSRPRRIAAQLGTQAAHFVEQSQGGSDEQTPAARAKRDAERKKVGLPPLYED